MTAETQKPAADVGSAPDPDTTAGWQAADRAHLERLIAAVDPTPSRWWWRRELPWLVVRQYHRIEHVVCAHRWEWVAELCAVRREARHPGQVGVHYTARHRTQVRPAEKAGGDR